MRPRAAVDDGVRSRAPVRRGVTVAAALALLLAGCTGPDDVEPGPEPTATAPAPEETEADGDVALPDHAAGRHAAWVLEQINAPDGTAVEDWSERASPEMIDALPVAQLEAALAQVRVLGPWTVRWVAGDERSLEVHLTGSTEQAVLLQVSVDATGRLQGLFFADPPPERDAAASLEDLAAEVGATSARTSLLVATVEDGRCVPVEGMPAGTAAGDALPVGSIVKLWVLGAVVDAVGRGDLAWTDQLTVTDDVRSLPSGELQDAPTGTTVTVEEAARGMIAISDNTATDLLIHAVGRDAVVDAMAVMGHHDPSLNDPLPTTRDLFRLGWSGDGQLKPRWRAADTAERATIFDEDPGGLLEIDAEALAVAAWPDRIDWFATAADVCAAHAWLAEVGDGGDGVTVDDAALVREILSANPGLGPDAVGAWEHAAFKGGSAPGTMAGAWYVEDADGRAHAVVLLTAARTPQLAVHPTTMVGIAEDALRLLR